MSREQRFRHAGILFYAVLAMAVLSTRWGAELVDRVGTSRDATGIFLTAIGAGAAILTSESMGFVFNLIAVFFWNLTGGRKPESSGYAAEWGNLTYDFRHEVERRYNMVASASSAVDDKGRPRKRWNEYGGDVFLSFFWQQAPSSLVGWVSRRHSAFFGGISAVCALGIGVVASIGIIAAYGMGLRAYTVMVFVLSAALAFALFHNALGAKREAWQFIDLWQRSLFDADLKKALDDVASGSRPGKEEIPRLKSRFRVMRRGDVKVREEENDRRLYYFDENVDMVVTTISKDHSEAPHFHAVSNEVYYVVQGSLLVSVDGQDVRLNEGDLIVVNAGCCHSFQTAEAGVTFLTVKDLAGLDDKRTC